MPEYWIVDPINEEIDVCCLTAGSYVREGAHGRGGTFSSPTLDGLRVSGAVIFAD